MKRADDSYTSRGIVAFRAQPRHKLVSISAAVPKEARRVAEWRHFLWLETPAVHPITQVPTSEVHRTHPQYESNIDFCYVIILLHQLFEAEIGLI